MVSSCPLHKSVLHKPVVHTNTTPSKKAFGSSTCARSPRYCFTFLADSGFQFSMFFCAIFINSSRTSYVWISPVGPTALDRYKVIAPLIVTHGMYALYLIQFLLLKFCALAIHL